MKKLTAFVLSLAMALSLAACGAKEASPAVSAPAASVPAASASVEETPAPEAELQRSARNVLRFALTRLKAKTE